MSGPRRRLRCVGVTLACLLAMLATGGRAEVILYRGEYVYLVPDAMSDRMLEFASRDAWEHFPSHTRRIDVDGDGQHDFIAIGLGASGGYGVQVRYRLRHDKEGGAPRLGRWYWGVITGPSGEKLFEKFNP